MVKKVNIILSILIVIGIAYLYTYYNGHLSAEPAVQKEEAPQTGTEGEKAAKPAPEREPAAAAEKPAKAPAPKPAAKPPAEPPKKEKVILDVPLLNQMDAPILYNGCEVTSLAMILNFHGQNVTKNELAKAIKRVPLKYSDGKNGNPHAGFVGNMERGPGLGVYHGPVYDLARKYVGDRAIDLTSSSFEEVLKQLDQGLPVWVIITSSFAPVSDFKTWQTPQGPIDVTFSEHSVAVTGYDSDGIYVNDPYGSKNKKVNRDLFIKAWEQMGKQAIVITK